MSNTGFIYPQSAAKIDNNDLKNSPFPSGTIIGYNFGISIPEGATIDGIEVVYNRRHNRSDYSPGDVQSDYQVYLGTYSGGTFTQNGNNMAGVATSNGPESVFRDDTYGGASDTWGTTFDRDDIVASNFAIMYRTSAFAYLWRNEINLCATDSAYVDLNMEGDYNFWIDSVKIKVYYTGGAPTVVPQMLVSM
jgi:hypothetical protein